MWIERLASFVGALSMAGFVATGTTQTPMVLVPYERSFTSEEMTSLENGVEAVLLRDEWDIYYDGVDVFFHRSHCGPLWCVMSMDTGARACAGLYVDSAFMDRLNRADVATEVGRLLDLVLNHVVFERPLEEPLSLDLMGWLGNDCFHEAP